jgi:hypothetical protein
MTSIEIHERLTRLERSNRLLKIMLSICLCCGAVVFLMGAATTGPKIIEAQKIVLKDANGKERGQLFATDKAWGLVLFNRNETKAASIFVAPEANGIFLDDANGNIRQSFTSDLSRSDWNIFRPGSDTPQFGMTDNEQGTALTFHDRANGERISLGVSAKGSGLTLSDENAQIKAAVTGTELGFASFSGDGELQWAPGWDKFSPEEKAKMKQLMPKLPN